MLRRYWRENFPVTLKPILPKIVFPVNTFIAKNNFTTKIFFCQHFFSKKNHPPCTARIISISLSSCSCVDCHAVLGITSLSTATAIPDWVGSSSKRISNSCRFKSERTSRGSPLTRIFIFFLSRHAERAYYFKKTDPNGTGRLSLKSHRSE